jgi:hypothetical protein
VNIRLHIERLVLDGLPIGAHDGRLVQAAVEAELSRLLTAGIAPDAFGQGFAVPGVRADAVQLEAGATPQGIGTQVAQAVHGGITR